MDIEFERSGGFAGMRLRASLQTESLPAATAGELEALVNQADFFNLPAQIAPDRSGADRFTYRVTVGDRGRRHTVEVGESAAPDALQPLLERLRREARR